MDQQHKNRRLAAVKAADAINAIEGAPVSEYVRGLSDRWAEGEITGAEMKAALLDAVCGEPVLYEESSGLSNAEPPPKAERYTKYQKEPYKPEPHQEKP